MNLIFDLAVLFVLLELLFLKINEDRRKIVKKQA